MISLGEIGQLLVGLAAVGAYLEARAARKSSKENAVKIQEVHLATNSLTDRLVASTQKEAHAAGMKLQKENDEHPHAG